MSISVESANLHKNEPAVVCCLTPKGTVITPSKLEDPAILPDLIESGLVTPVARSLTIGQVLGAVAAKDIDALSPLTADLLEKLPQTSSHDEKKAGPSSVYEKAPLITPEKTAAPGVIRISVEELKGLKLEIPAGCFPLNSLTGLAPAPLAPAASQQVPSAAAKEESAFAPPSETIIRSLVQREFPVKEVRIGGETSFSDGVLTIRDGLCEEALSVSELVKKVEIDIITPDKRHVFSNTVMDVIPVAAKVQGILGEGVTHVLSGVVFLLTGLDEAGLQMHEFGSCEGFLDEKIRYGRPGCPDPQDIMIRVNVVIRENTGMERRGPYAAHKACDYIIQEIREIMKLMPAKDCQKEETFHDRKKTGKPRVVIIKEIMGQGAMHDNVLLPIEPAGVKGGRQNVDLGNIPVVLSPNEVRDGGIHALTCIGPATKEDTRHYFREPLVKLLDEDDELALVGVVFIGSPQVNDEKMFVAARLGSLVEALNVDGAIVTTEGFGNNHIDFAENINQIGMRGVPVVGVSFCAYQGQLVVGNKYMDAMIELNKDPEGFESEILGDSTLCLEDAQRAVLMLKTKMAGIPIAPADRKWSQTCVDENQKLCR